MKWGDGKAVLNAIRKPREARNTTRSWTTSWTNLRTNVVNEMNPGNGTRDLRETSEINRTGKRLSASEPSPALAKQILHALHGLLQPDRSRPCKIQGLRACRYLSTCLKREVLLHFSSWPILNSLLFEWVVSCVACDGSRTCGFSRRGSGRNVLHWHCKSAGRPGLWADCSANTFCSWSWLLTGRRLHCDSPILQFLMLLSVRQWICRFFAFVGRFACVYGCADVSIHMYIYINTYVYANLRICASASRRRGVSAGVRCMLPPPL